MWYQLRRCRARAPASLRPVVVFRVFDLGLGALRPVKTPDTTIPDVVASCENRRHGVLCKHQRHQTPSITGLGLGFGFGDLGVEVRGLGCRVYG